MADYMAEKGKMQTLFSAASVRFARAQKDAANQECLV